MNLIITPPNSPIFISLNGFPIRYYGVIMALVFLVGILFASYIFKKRFNISEMEKFIDYSPFVILFALVGARLFYVVGCLDFYSKNPIEIFLINHGGLSIFGAIFFGILALYILSKIKNFDFFKHIDVIALVFPLCQSIGRYGNFFNQEAYGMPTNGILKLFVSSEYRKPEFINFEYYHPAFLYESVLDLVLFVVLLKIYFSAKNLKSGSIACLYLVFYSVIRFIVEGIRLDSVLNIASMPIARIICIFLFLTSIIFLFLLNKKAPNNLDA